MSSPQESKEKKATRGVDMDAAASRRREAAVTLRAKKKDELLREKRRNIDDGAAQHADPMAPAGGMQTSDATGFSGFNPAATTNAATAARLPELAKQLHAPSPDQVLEATVAIRKMLSREHNPPIDEVIQAGCVQRLVQLLDHHDMQTLQFEAAWALTNIASGTSQQCMYVIQANACPQFVQLLGSQNEDVREQAVWALGNIAGDSAQCRDLVLSLGALERVLHIIADNPGPSILRNATWAMSNCIRSKPVPDLHKIAQALPVATALLGNLDDAVVIDAAWALSYASDGPNDRIDAVLAHDPVPKLIQLMMRDQQTICTPALRTIGNIVTGTTEQTQKVIDGGALPVVHQLMSHPNKGIRKECCWFISNVTAGSQAQIQAVINTSLIPVVIAALNASEYEVRKEAAWAIANLTTGGSREQIHYTMQTGCLPPLLEQLSVPDPKIVIVALEALENILRSGEGIATEQGCDNAYKTAVLERGGVEKIEELQHHASDEVYRKSIQLLEEYFEAEEDANAMQQGMDSNDLQQAAIDAAAQAGAQAGAQAPQAFTFGAPQQAAPAGAQPGFNF